MKYTVRLLLYLLTLCFGISTFAAGKTPPLNPFTKFILYNEQNLMVLDGGDPDKLASDKNLQAKKYRPGPGAVFPIKSYWIDNDDVDVFMGKGFEQVADQFYREAGEKIQYRLIVHPESEIFYRKVIDKGIPGKKLIVAPTASSRTLLTWPETGNKTFFTKVSLNRQIGEVVRTIGRNEVIRSIGVNDILMADKAFLPRGFYFLPEVFGLISKDAERGGMIVRIVPEALIRGKTRFMPLFSLYADAANGDLPPLAVMINQSRLKPADFIAKKIFSPFIRQWLDLAVNRGITMEPHGQNVLIGLNSEGMPNGTFLHRDFGGFNIDYEFRYKNNLPLPQDISYYRSSEENFLIKKHNEMLFKSLNAYFIGGVVYDLEKRLPLLAAAGEIPFDLRLNALTDMFKAELQKQMDEMTGTHLTIWKDLRNIPSVVRKAREIVYSADTESCDGGLRQLALRKAQ